MPKSAKQSFILLFAFCFLPVSSYSQDILGSVEDINKYSYINWEAPHTVESVKIRYIYDGDTVQDHTGRKIRFLGLNTPEVENAGKGLLVSEPGADEAARYTDSLIRGRQVLLVIDDETSEDVYGRTLALIFYKDIQNDMRCLNWELVKNGYADVSIFPDNRLCVEHEWYWLSLVSKRRKPEDFSELAELALNGEYTHEAIKEYQNGIKKFPDNRMLYEKLGRLYLVQELPGFSVDVFLAYLEKHPDDVNMRKQLAFSYERMILASGSLSLVDYRKKAVSEWEKLLNTDCAEEAEQRLRLLGSTARKE